MNEDSKTKFLKQFAETIDQVANQDAVRTATLRQERESGTTDELIGETAYIVGQSVQAGLNNGLNTDQAFAMALYQSGLMS